jgi:hypothetical protein
MEDKFLTRKIEAPFPIVLAYIARDVGHLQRDAELDSIRNPLVILKADDVHAHQSGEVRRDQEAGAGVERAAGT